MARGSEFRGVFAYPLTPTRDDGARVDEKRLCELIDEFLEAGCHGIVVLGSTGAIGSFSEEERKSLAALIAEIDRGRGGRNLSSALRVWVLNRLMKT